MSESANCIQNAFILLSKRTTMHNADAMKVNENKFFITKNDNNKKWEKNFSGENKSKTRDEMKRKTKYKIIQRKKKIQFTFVSYISVSSGWFHAIASDA